MLGHARQGSIRAPQWTHGGVALGPKPRSYYFTINKKVKRLALLSALSDKAANGNMILVEMCIRDSFYTMLRQARTFNLIFYLLLAVLAVALAPAAVRGLLACIAMLPMPCLLYTSSGTSMIWV